MSVFTRRGRRSVVLLAVLAIMAALLAPGPAQAKSKRELTVMTQNLYLGASLAPALELAFLPEPTGEQFVTAVATIYGSVLFTDIETRSEAIAAEIAANRPDIIGLQEVSRWIVTDPVGAPAPIPGFDFLEILLEDLEDVGLGYGVAAVSNNALLGPYPLALCDVSNPFACFVTFEDRDVILVADDSGVEDVVASSGNYTAQVVLELDIPPFPPQSLSFNRGWTLIDGTFEGKEFRFVNTHLETEQFPPVQEAQTDEFLAGPASVVDRPVIAVGDFNSAADGSTTASYDLLTSSFSDAWGTNRRAPGPTCCQASDLANKKSELGSRIDLVLTRGVAKVWPAQVVTNKRFEKKTAPFWASDHAGVVAVIQLG